MESKAKKIIDKFKSAGSDGIDDDLNVEVTILRDILQKRRLGANAHLQTASGAMVDINAPVPDTTEEEDTPDKPKTTTAADVISAASCLGGV